MNTEPADAIVEEVPVARPVNRQPTEAEYWAERYAKAYGGTAHRKVARAYRRAQKKKVKVANRRRFRQWVSDVYTAGTIGQQLRILAGEFGTDQQRVRIEAEYRKIAEGQGVEFDAMVAQMREQLGLEALVR